MAKGSTARLQHTLPSPQMCADAQRTPSRACTRVGAHACGGAGTTVQLHTEFCVNKCANMHNFVCICAHGYMHRCANMHVCMQTCTYMTTCTHTCTHVFAYAHTHAQTCTHTPIHAHVHKHAHMHPCTHTSVHMQTSTHTPMHKHADMHTHVHVSLPDPPMVPTHLPPRQGHGVAMHTPPQCSAASLPRTQLPWQCLGHPAEDNAEHPPLPVHPWPKQKHALFCTIGAPHTSLTWLFHVRLWPAAIRLHGWECISENSGWVEDGWFCFPEMLLRYYLTTLGKKSKRQKKKKKPPMLVAW